MIVLDEQLLGHGLEEAIGHWYPGTVADITQLRPNTWIDDDEIPAILLTARDPLFVTINVPDFWNNLRPHRGFGIACFALPHEQIERIAPLLRRVLGMSPFDTKRKRMGKILRIINQGVQFYSLDQREPRFVEWP